MSADQVTSAEPRRSVEVLSLHPEVYASQSRGRRGNLASSLDAHRAGNPEFWNRLKGQSVLVRPNIVDPDHPQGCSNTEALECTLEQLILAGISKITIGDLPSADYSESHPQSSPQLIYKDVIEKLAKQFPQVTISLSDLQDLKRVQLTETGLPIIDTSEFAALINLALPKEHGQYFFSCATKHLMGLVETSARRDYFHHDYSKEARDRVLSRDGQQIQQEVDALWSPGSLNSQVEFAARLNVRVASEFNPANMKKMATFIKDVTNSLDRSGTQILTIVDGYETLTGQEHTGDLTKTDLAVVGSNPLAVDLTVANTIGLLEQVGYLTELSPLVKPKIKGDQLSPAPPYTLKQIPRDITSPDQRGRFTYKVGVVRE